MNVYTIEGHTSMYPWVDWLNGKCWYVRMNGDFTCMTASIRSQAHGWGKVLGMSVTTRDVDHGVLIQAYRPGSTWKPNLAAITVNRLTTVIENMR